VRAARPAACGRPACFRPRRHVAPNGGDGMRSDFRARRTRRARPTVATGAAGDLVTRTTCASSGRPRCGKPSVPVSGATHTQRRSATTASRATPFAWDAQCTRVRLATLAKPAKPPIRAAQPVVAAHAASSAPARRAGRPRRLGHANRVGPRSWCTLPRLRFRKLSDIPNSMTQCARRSHETTGQTVS